MEDMRTRGLPLSQLPRRIFIATAVTLGLPISAAFYVLFKIGAGQFTFPQLGLLIVFLIFSLLGTGLGFHRYFAHQSFKSSRGLKYLLGILGCSGGLGSISWFSALHRRHHRFADGDRNPHTPNFPEIRSVPGFLSNSWFSSFGFAFRFGLYALHLLMPEQDVAGLSKDFRNSVKDLTSDPDVRWIERRYYLWIFTFYLIPGMVLWAVTRQSNQFWQGTLWGGLARMGFNQLIFGFINVIGHLHGQQPYRSNDESRNLYWFALISCGESLHNNHHAFPWTAKSGLAWWQLDLNYYFLVLFKKLGWASEVRVPTPAELDKKRRLPDQAS